MSAAVVISPLSSGDYDDWLRLWTANNNGQIDPSVTAETWRRLLLENSPVRGFAAHADGIMAGFAHYILHPVTGHIAPVCYMQDLFVDPSFRNRGIGRLLVEYLAAEGRSARWARLYWLAENNNEAARALYKNLGYRLDFSLHVLPLS